MAEYKFDNYDDIVLNGTSVDKVVFNGNEVWTSSGPEMDLIVSNNWDIYITSGNFGRRYLSEDAPTLSNNKLEIKMPDEVLDKYPSYINITHKGEDRSAFGDSPYSRLEIHLMNSDGSPEEYGAIEHTSSSYQEQTYGVQNQFYLHYIWIHADGTDISAEEYVRFIRNIEVVYSDGTVVSDFV